MLRAILGEAANAAKTDSPLKTDVQILSLLKKRIASSQAASKEFAHADRPDLKLKQDEEIGVMNEYASQIQTISREDIETAIDQVHQKLQETPRLNVGMVMKELFGPGGVLDGKPVERAEVSKLVQESFKKMS